MMPEEYDKHFKPWYDQQKDITDWSFKDELIKYCRADVELLSKTILKLITFLLYFLEGVSRILAKRFLRTLIKRRCPL